MDVLKYYLLTVLSILSNGIVRAVAIFIIVMAIVNRRKRRKK